MKRKIMKKKNRGQIPSRKFLWIVGVFWMTTIFGVLLTLSAVETKTTSFNREAKTEDGAMEATAVLTPVSPRISDELTLTVTVRHDPALTIEKTEIGENYGSFRVEKIDVPAPVIDGGRRTDQFVLTLVPTESGDVSLLPIPLRAISENAGDSTEEKNKKSVTLTIPAGTVRIESAFARRSASLADLTGPQGVIPKSRWPWIFGGILLGAIVLAAILIAYRGRRHEKTAATPPLSPSQRALAALDRLMASKIYQTDVRAFYLELTGIVRQFLEETTGLRAPEETTEEFLETLRQTSSAQLDESIRRELPPFLEFSDLVKFAKFRPSEAEIFEGVAKARRVVETITNPSEEDLTSEAERKRSAVENDATNETKGEI